MEKGGFFAAYARGKPPGVPGAADGAGYSGSIAKGQENRTDP